jgi:P-type E1-E2 ATPase
MDAEMTIPDFKIKDVKHCKVRNLNMIEELAQIEYLFCDKTGTLTQNELVFKQVSIFDNGKKVFQADKS